ncbi:putative esterase domain protein [Mycobacteroides abscessus 1948]|uniref:Putative esterase domain protein n=1 Tax=Mycobacteroides abscessus 1948 TaxID=1299323 RepID=A0A829QED9_9MYCO|nr:putative esterase domain protein [Mycobacteroides abscessus 1948]
MHGAAQNPVSTSGRSHRPRSRRRFHGWQAGSARRRSLICRCRASPCGGTVDRYVRYS